MNRSTALEVAEILSDFTAIYKELDVSNQISQLAQLQKLITVIDQQYLYHVAKPDSKNTLSQQNEMLEKLVARRKTRLDLSLRIVYELESLEDVGLQHAAELVKNG